MVVLPLALLLVRQSPVAVVPRLTLAESGRYEVKTTGGSTFGGSWSETQTASRTKVTITAELPLAGLVVDGDTRLYVRVGDFSIEGTPKGDPAYRPGATSARVVSTEAALGKAAIRPVVGKADLRWNADRLTVRIVADSPDGPSAAAATFKNGQIGPFEAIAQGRVEFGARKAEFTLPIKGRIARKSVDLPGLSGSATTVDLKGEAKAG